ncbi:MAG: Rieske 2Fe-2S domain-containing protein [Patescibacteria group bacterium]|nr:Rieske 2Fe-2S domain-containing protein [Patescibacteria group bacterium]MDD5716020.1 Rieske 2Fe-2S domain-containing protein [Patescibacteria group bacterium]
MPFKKAMSAADLPSGTMKHVNIGGVEVLVANVGGAYYAINNRCPHMGGSIAEGKLEGTIARCPQHGAAFDLSTGKNVGPAKVAFMKLKVKDAVRYPVKAEGGDIFVDVA